MATLEAGTTLKVATTRQRHTVKNSVEIRTCENTHLKTTFETTSHPAGRDERERESPTIHKKEQLICYDQQAKQQCSTTLATNPPKTSCNSRVSHTAIGDDRRPPCSSLRWLKTVSSTNISMGH